MNIINIAVIIVIDIIVRNLTLIHPHVVHKVRVSILYTLVADCHDDPRITRYYAQSYSYFVVRS